MSVCLAELAQLITLLLYIFPFPVFLSLLAAFFGHFGQSGILGGVLHSGLTLTASAAFPHLPYP